MTKKYALSDPISSLTEWKLALFPEISPEEDYKENTPTDTAVKWSTRALDLLPNKSLNKDAPR